MTYWSGFIVFSIIIIIAIIKCNLCSKVNSWYVWHMKTTFHYWPTRASVSHSAQSVHVPSSAQEQVISSCSGMLAEAWLVSLNRMITCTLNESMPLRSFKQYGPDLNVPCMLMRNTGGGIRSTQVMEKDSLHTLTHLFCFCQLKKRNSDKKLRRLVWLHCVTSALPTLYWTGLPVKDGAVAAPLPLRAASKSWSWITGKKTLWLNHIQSCFVLCHPHESSLCLLLRHSRAHSWAPRQFSGPNPRRCLQIYTGMCADILSSRVNTPRDFYLFAHVRRPDSTQQKTVGLTSAHFWPLVALTPAVGGRSAELCDLFSAAPFLMSSPFCTVCRERFLQQQHSYKGLRLWRRW